MTEADDEPVTDPTDEPATDDERRRRRARVFGDVLPDTTLDESGDEPTERSGRDAADEWLRRQVPPHHG